MCCNTLTRIRAGEDAEEDVNYGNYSLIDFAVVLWHHFEALKRIQGLLHGSHTYPTYLGCIWSMLAIIVAQYPFVNADKILIILFLVTQSYT